MDYEDDSGLAVAPPEEDEFNRRFGGPPDRQTFLQGGVAPPPPDQPAPPVGTLPPSTVGVPEAPQPPRIGPPPNRADFPTPHYSMARRIGQGIGGALLQKWGSPVGTQILEHAVNPASVAEEKYNKAQQEYQANLGDVEKQGQMGETQAKTNLTNQQATQFDMVPVQDPEHPEQPPMMVPRKNAEALQGAIIKAGQAKATQADKDALAKELADIRGKQQLEHDTRETQSRKDIAEMQAKVHESIAAASRQLQQWKAQNPTGKVPPLVGKAKDSYEDSVSRLNIMQQNLDAGLKGDQQAMLSLLANHLGMTLGLAKGARINQAIIKEAEASAPWLGRIEARFDDRGYLSGVVLTPEQMHSMVALGLNRMEQDGRKLNEMENYFKINPSAQQGGKVTTNAPGGNDLGPAPAGKAEGSTGTLPNGDKVKVIGGRLIKQ